MGQGWDVNSKLFYRLLNARKARKFISKLEKDDRLIE